jgi:hypothetical protein
MWLWREPTLVAIRELALHFGEYRSAFSHNASLLRKSGDG